MKKNLLSITLIALFFSLSIKAQTTGTLSVVFTPTVPASPIWYNSANAGKYVIAVWIQSSAGTFAATKYRYFGGSTNDHLPNWVAKSASSTVGATTGATRSSFAAMTFTWNGKNAAGTSVLTDGAYDVIIEETWGHGSSNHTSTLTITKGTSPATVTPTNTSWVNGASLIWQPDLTSKVNELSSSNPEVIVYPNPSQGVFNIDYKSANTIKVFNTIGTCIYSEEINGSNNGNKAIDLSRFANGIYVITVSNKEYTSNHKVILNK